METATIYASYGVLAHEHETLWGMAPYEGACDADRVTVALPDGYSFYESVSDEPVVEDSDGNVCLLAECLVKVAKNPRLTFPTGDTWHSVPLTVVSREGWTVR